MRQNNPSGPTLFTIYQNLFASETEEIQAFQQAAAGALFSEEGKDRFLTILTALNDGAPPELSEPQMEALSYVMGASSKASLVRPWDDTPAW